MSSSRQCSSSFGAREEPHLHPNGLEESRVSKWELHHFLDLSQLLSAASDVIIAHFVQRFLFILAAINRDKEISEKTR